MTDPRLRRSLLIVPGNRPGRVLVAMTLPADSFIFDLEGSVPLVEKAQARDTIAEALRSASPGGREFCVRLNPIGTPDIEHDLNALPLGRVDSLMLPKVERASDLVAFERRLDELELAAGRTTPIDLVVGLETPRGILGALAIAEAGRRVSALVFGSGAYAQATGSATTAAALVWPRSVTVAAASAAGLQPIDADAGAGDDAEASRRDAALMRDLGFVGRVVARTNDISSANEIFAPDPDQIAWARRIAEAHRDAESRGLAAVSIDGSLVAVDTLVTAERTLRRAALIAARSG
ncbi:HpcH/HpaI aldolase/citrate lyase family protein [Enterovirga rhinocerotis]|uniref:Citrate lyase subunit beta/citryl-CoA lyase/(3S)-malyl-CoA thioesterase n=1 Tax=Enterovirga rhinocerotis TaxID=1339210 RepID=A0A4R7BJ20_9HYPH|nr:CoA ester lyase [Enterovirga rhinocerotis]TDR85151.1 citrate lyase subunit beta/citryl-CoA lyase/(3S)-malyl-CoA thioesterase [Enterovirga rhinocerotis]